MVQHKDRARQLCMLSFDVEDWFHANRFRKLLPPSTWDRCEVRVATNVKVILRLLQKYQRRATFFVLGWVAERFPSLVHQIHSDGHEIASHGYGHEPLFNLGEPDFEADVCRSKEILESLVADEIIGYRAPDCSIVDYVPKILAEHGFRYDSSLFPSSFSRRYGRMNLHQIDPALSIGRLHNGLLEVPITTLPLLGRDLPWGGGGYFRFYPYWLFRRGIRAFLRRKSGYLFYGHPWDLDPYQPRVAGASLPDRIFHYGFLSKTRRKLERLLHDVDFVPIREGLETLGLP